MDTHDTDKAIWEKIQSGFAMPFLPEQVEFRVQGRPNEQGQAAVVAYVDARAVAQRLDDVVGAGAWSFDWEALAIGETGVTIVKGRLTVHGVTKCDVGDAGDTEPTKSSVSDALKRTAVMWGIGRYLYDLPRYYVQTETRGKTTVITKDGLAGLRAKLAGLSKSATSVATQAAHPAQAAEHELSAPPARGLSADEEFDQLGGGRQALAAMPATALPAGYALCPQGCGVAVKEFISRTKMDAAGQPSHYFREKDGGFHDCPMRVRATA